jgi:hypothetical protein
MLLDHPAPVIIGQTMYGFGKQLAGMRTTLHSFDVRSPAGSLAAQFAPTGVPGDISQFKEISDVRGQLELPLVGVAKDGSFVFSFLHYYLDGATFQRVDGHVRVVLPFLPNVKEITLRGDVSTKPWGFRMQSEWSLSLPFGDVTQRTPSQLHNTRAVAEGYTRAIGIPLRR